MLNEFGKKFNVPIHVRNSASFSDEPGTVIQGRAFIDIEIDPTLTGVAKSSCELIGFCTRCHGDPANGNAAPPRPEAASLPLLVGLVLV